MVDSHSAFIGEIPRNYEKNLSPLIFREYAKDLAKRISVPSGGAVLETAAGTGMAIRQLRDELPEDVRIVVTDLNEEMLDVAKGKFESNENIEFQVWERRRYRYCGKRRI